MNILRNMVAFALLAPTSALAATWHANGNASTLTFSFVTQGETFTGKFKSFEANITFDPTQLATSRFDVKVTLASSDTGSPDRDDPLHGKDFFDVAHWPTATYTAVKFRSLGGNRYAADGMLDLHGVSKPVSLAFTWTAGATPTLTGDAVVNRLDFKVGDGYADPSAVSTSIKVHTALKLAPAATASK